MLEKLKTISACVLSVALCAGCSDLDNCADGRDDLPPIERANTTDLATLTYVSAPWGGPLDAFPPNSNLRFVHDLGFAPFFVKAYVSFSKDGTADGGDGDVTENAGNQGRIQCVDEHEIVIENDTCEENFFVRVVAMSNGKEPPPLVSCEDENR